MGPLEGTKVVELAGIGPGPFACMLLADLGADVVRVTRPGGPAPALDTLLRGRPALAADLKSAEGKAAVLELIERADVLIEGFRPGVAERLGLGPEDCRAINPRLVYGRMTGWGQDGPLAERAGHDINYLSLTGGLHAIGEAGRRPVPPLNLVADFGGGSLYLIMGVLAALVERQASGLGQVVDAAMVDGASSLLAMAQSFRAMGIWADERGVNMLDGGTPFYRTYETLDGGWMAVGCLEAQFFAAFEAGLGVALPPQADRDRWPEMQDVIATAFAGRTRAEWTAIYAGTDACVTPVLSLGEAPDGPHLAARGSQLVIETGSGPATVPAAAPRLSRTPGRAGAPAGAPGPLDASTRARWGLTDGAFGAGSGPARD
jgi:alpha-methylacyl-CoA racemase